MGIEVFKKHLREKRAVKVIVSENNTTNNVKKICNAAQKGHASMIDIPFNQEFFDIARKNTKLPICVTSIHPFELLKSVQNGAIAIHIGNFHKLNNEGVRYSTDEIYDIVLETMSLISKYDVFTTITVPGTISPFEQTQLAKKFEILGANMLQVEGFKMETNASNEYYTSATEAINNTLNLMKTSSLPLVTASGMDEATSRLAFENGASCVGVEFIENHTATETVMTTKIMQVVGAISHRNSINREIVRNSRELFI